ncbi:GSCOCT00013833001.3-RA-CDS, partial [Cotesia congregata]
MKVKPERIFKITAILGKITFLIWSDKKSIKKLLLQLIWWILMVNSTILAVLLGIDAYKNYDNINTFVDIMTKLSIRVEIVFDYIIWKFNSRQL